MKTIKILSIDGGGIRGLIPAMILAKIEEITSKPVSQLFDLIAGTSTGGILALALAMPSKDNKEKPAYTAHDLIKLYADNGKKIFSSNIFHKIISMDGIAEEKYPSSGIESVLKEYFGKTMLSESLTNLIIPSYELGLRVPYFFKSIHAKDTSRINHDFYMWQVARSTSAAPTYFEPYKLDIGDKGGADYYALIDGGVFANNPAMCAYAEAKVMFGNTPDILMFSLGTGEHTCSIPYDKAKDWGLMDWAKPILGTVFGGVSDTVDYQLSQVLPENMYYRIQASLAQLGSDAMDDASEENIHELKLLGLGLIEEWERNGKLEKLCNLLTT
ncbi:MAG TPA: CBASS cGAMP-activated phospholipase [Ruminiclostridium sp.]|nr:CBASS cGAMP-activated phospholipase [Ruminiclostridium sp.]